MLDGEPCRRRDTVEDGHPQVHEHDVGMQRVDQVERLRAVLGGTDDRDLLADLEKGRQRLAEQRLVVNDQDAYRSVAPQGHAGSSTRTARPVPGVDSTVREPPSRSARSRMPMRPNPPLLRSIAPSISPSIALSTPRPSSLTSRRTTYGRYDSRMVAACAFACLRTLVSPSWATR